MQHRIQNSEPIGKKPDLFKDFDIWGKVLQPEKSSAIPMQVSHLGKLLHIKIIDGAAVTALILRVNNSWFSIEDAIIPKWKPA